MSQDYGKFWEASLVYDLFIGIQLVRIFSSMLQQGEVNLEKSAITLKYAMDAERIYKDGEGVTEMFRYVFTQYCKGNNTSHHHIVMFDFLQVI